MKRQRNDASTPSELTPSQTVGPFLSIGLTWDDGPDVVPEGTPGRVTVGGTVHDGAGDPVTDALVEVWALDPDGRPGPTATSTASPARAGGRGRHRHPPGPGPRPAGHHDRLRRPRGPDLDVGAHARGLLRTWTSTLGLYVLLAPHPRGSGADPRRGTRAPRGRTPPARRPGRAARAGPARGRRPGAGHPHLQGAHETPFLDASHAQASGHGPWATPSDLDALVLAATSHHPPGVRATAARPELRWPRRARQRGREGPRPRPTPWPAGSAAMRWTVAALSTVAGVVAEGPTSPGAGPPAAPRRLRAALAGAVVVHLQYRCGGDEPGRRRHRPGPAAAPVGRPRPGRRGGPLAADACADLAARHAGTPAVASAPWASMPRRRHVRPARRRLAVRPRRRRRGGPPPALGRCSWSSSAARSAPPPRSATTARTSPWPAANGSTWPRPTWPWHWARWSPVVVRTFGSALPLLAADADKVAEDLLLPLCGDVRDVRLRMGRREPGQDARQAEPGPALPAAAAAYWAPGPLRMLGVRDGRRGRAGHGRLASPGRHRCWTLRFGGTGCAVAYLRARRPGRARGVQTTQMAQGPRRSSPPCCCPRPAVAALAPGTGWTTARRGCSSRPLVIAARQGLGLEQALLRDPDASGAPSLLHGCTPPWTRPADLGSAEATWRAALRELLRTRAPRGRGRHPRPPRRAARWLGPPGRPPGQWGWTPSPSWPPAGAPLSCWRGRSGNPTCTVGMARSTPSWPSAWPAPAYDHPGHGKLLPAWRAPASPTSAGSPCPPAPRCAVERAHLGSGCPHGWAPGPAGRGARPGPGRPSPVLLCTDRPPCPRRGRRSPPSGPGPRRGHRVAGRRLAPGAAVVLGSRAGASPAGLLCLRARGV